jgi:hypothetical protein
LEIKIHRKQPTLSAKNIYERLVAWATTSYREGGSGSSNLTIERIIPLPSLAKRGEAGMATAAFATQYTGLGLAQRVTRFVLFPSINTTFQCVSVRRFRKQRR